MGGSQSQKKETKAGSVPILALNPENPDLFTLIDCDGATHHGEVEVLRQIAKSLGIEGGDTADFMTLCKSIRKASSTKAESELNLKEEKKPRLSIDTFAKQPDCKVIAQEYSKA